MAQGTSKSGQKSGSRGQRSSASRSGGSGSRSTSGRSGSSSNGASAKPRNATRSRSSSSRSRPASSSRRSQSSRASSSGARKPGGGSRSSGRKGSPVSRTTSAVKDRVQSTGGTVAGAIGSAAEQAKGPAIAGGAAIAGLVGGMTIASRGARRRVLGLPIPGTKQPLIQVKRPTRVNTTRDLVKAAGHMGNAGRQMAELASEMRLAREQMGNGRRRSPVEVVLEGLTSRRLR